MKGLIKVTLVVLAFNALLIFSCVKEGLDNGDILLRFHERQAVTFLSALMLGLTSLVSLVLYLMKRRMSLSSKSYRFWLACCIGFFYLCMDEYFMAHEGIDEIIGSLFGKDIKSWGLDGLVLGAFGLIALAICFYFRKEIFKHREMLPFLCLGGFCLLGTAIFDQLDKIKSIHIEMEVIEESFKIIGVSFFFAGFLGTLFSFIKRISVSCPEV